MPKTKWIMKQYWRVGTIRALLSLGLGMFTIGKLYLHFVPILSDFGVFGALVLGSMLFLFFLALGWFYDVKAKMWSYQSLVNAEHNPYMFVPNLKGRALDYPFQLAVISTLKNVVQKAGLKTDRINAFYDYMGLYFSRGLQWHSIVQAKKTAREFMDAYPFLNKPLSPKKIKFRQKAKKQFELMKLRLTWIQSLTGMAQDALVFGALYIVIIMPGIEQVRVNYLLYGILLLSFPLYSFFVIAGWFYDRKLRVWSADVTVKIERNPFTYVPEPRMRTMVFPFIIPFLHTMRSLFEKAGIDTTLLDEKIEYFKTYITLGPENVADIKVAQELRESLKTIFFANKW